MSVKPRSKIELVGGRKQRVALYVEPVGDSRIQIMSAPATEDADLRPLYEFGALYHEPHRRLRSSWTAAWDAVLAMATADRVAMRGYVTQLLESATEMESVAETLSKLRGVESVAALVRRVLVTVDELGVRGQSVDDLDVVTRALSHLDVQRSAVLVNVEIAAEDALLRQWLDATAPIADGAIGVETMGSIEDDAKSAVAWHAWRSAGLGIKWDVAWDTWWVLDRYKFEAIGAARGKSADAVTKSRRR